MAWVCRHLGAKHADLTILCPARLPDGSQAPSGSRRGSWRVLTDRRCAYLVELEAGQHVMYGGRCRGWGPTEHGRWPAHPNLKDYLGLVGVRSEVPGEARQQPELELPSSAGRVRVRGRNGLVLRVAPYPDGGIHGGHVALIWNEHGHGYMVSAHGYEDGQGWELASDASRDLVRMANSMVVVSGRRD